MSLDLSPLDSNSLTRDSLVTKSDVEALIERVATQMERRLQQFINARIPTEPKAPIVNVAAGPAPSVNVAPPTVNVTTPPVDVTVELDALLTGISTLSADIRAFHQTLLKPVITTVHRDMDHLIDKTTQTR